jgi:hypothetical protein
VVGSEYKPVLPPAGETMGTESDKQNFIEKRKHPRKKTSIEYKLANFKEEFDAEGVTVNLSTHGVLCQVEKPIPEMTELKLLLKLPNDYAECMGTVVRVRKCSDAENKYDIAIYFNDIKPVDKKKIADFIGE